MLGKIDKNEILALAIGRFDGVHLGHQRIFDLLGSGGGVLIIENGTSILTPRRELITDLPCFYCHLSEIRELSPKEFVEKISLEFPKLKRLVVGFDFHFGKNRSGDINTLKAHFKGEIIVIDEFKLSGIGVHSTKIKEFLANGNIQKVSEFLGRNYSIWGQVVRGNGIGSKELMPTINTQSNYFLPKKGVYATFVRINEQKFQSVTFVGKRLSIDNQFSIETYILGDFDENVSNEIEIEFVEFLRDNAKFSDLTKLKTQILADISKAKEILKGQK